MPTKPRTPAASQNAATPVGNKKITLPSGAVCEKIPFKGKHIREAIRIGGDDPIKSVFAMISVCSLIDGKKLTVEEIDELPGEDVIELMQEFQGLF